MTFVVMNTSVINPNNGRCFVDSIGLCFVVEFDCVG